MKTSICKKCKEPIHYNEQLRNWYHDPPMPRLQDAHRAAPGKVTK